MKSAIVGTLVAFASLASAGAASAQVYAPDTVIGIDSSGLKVTYADYVQLTAFWADDVRKAGGCSAYVQERVGSDGKLTDGSVLLLGVDPLIAACNEGLAGK